MALSQLSMPRTHEKGSPVCPSDRDEGGRRGEPRRGRLERGKEVSTRCTAREENRRWEVVSEVKSKNTSPEKAIGDTFHVPESPMITNSELDFETQTDHVVSAMPPMTLSTTPSTRISPATPPRMTSVMSTSLCMPAHSLEMGQEEELSSSLPSLVETAGKNDRKRHVSAIGADISLCPEEEDRDSTPPLFAGGVARVVNGGVARCAGRKRDNTSRTGSQQDGKGVCGGYV